MKREFDEFNSLNYIELPIMEQACGLRQVPRRGGRKGVAPLNKGLSRSDWGLRRSEAEAHAPPGLSPSGDWGWTDRIL